MSDKVNAVKIKLGFYHQRDSVPARLSNGQIVEIDKSGVVVDETLVSDEMRACGLYEIEDWKESLKEHSAFVADTAMKLHGVLTAMRDSADGSEKPEEHRQDADDTDAEDTVADEASAVPEVVKETAAAKRAREKAEKKAAEEKAKLEQDSQETKDN